MPFCTECGSQNADTAKFCSQCGHRLVTPPGQDAGGRGGPDAGDRRGVGDQPSQEGSSSAGSAEVASETTASMSFQTPPAKGVTPEQREESLNEADAAAVDALPTGSALLVVQRGPSAGSRFLLDLELVTAGRHPDSEIFLDDVTVSRRHAEFRRHERGYSVRDVGSLNGTYVNRDRIDEVVLQGGDEVQIGKFRLVFFASHAGVSATR